SSPLARARRVRDEEVGADELEPAAEPRCQRDPALPVVLGEPVLDREDRVAPGPLLPEGDHLLGALGRALALEQVALAAAQLARRRVERDRDLLARAVARLLDRS